MRSTKSLEYGIILVLTAIWGSAFSLVKIALLDFTPWQLILARFFPTVPIFAVICWYARKRFASLVWSDWVKLVGAGASGIVFYNFALNTGQTIVGASIAAIVIALNPPVILLLAVIFRGERVKRKFILGMAVSFIGVSLLSLSRDGFAIDHNALRGIGYILFCPLTWGTYTILQADLVPKLGPFATPAASVLAGCLLLLPSLPNSFPNGLPVGWIPWLCALSLGLLSTVVAFSLWAWLLQHRGAARTGIVVYLNVVWGVLTATLLLGEDFTLPMALGALLIILGVVITRHARRVKPEPIPVKS
jgi:drug/metabolite transporter (DMT)-like permease